MLAVLRYSLALSLLLAGPLPAATIYTWIAEDGSRMFSDQPHPAAERLEIGPVPSVPAYRPPAAAATAPTNSPAPVAYRQLAILTPRDGETIHSGPGNLPVQVYLEPPLRSEHRLRLLLDGQPGTTQQHGLFLLQHLDRGTHQLKAQILDERQQVLLESPDTTFYLHRPSRLRQR